MREVGPAPGCITDAAEDDGAGSLRKLVELVRFNQLDAFRSECVGVVILVGEFIREGEDAVAGLPVETAEEDVNPPPVTELSNLSLDDKRSNKKKMDKVKDAGFF